jgi:nitronate monooxygenase
MGIGVSDWRLARAVARRGHLGVVSGTSLDSLFVRRLQDGDPGGHMRRAMRIFPLPGVSERVLTKYFRPDGRPEGVPYDLLPLWKQRVSRGRAEITVLANFVEVYLAREGHDGLVGINLLTKLQLPNLATLYGAMLAGVDHVLMGAGIPRDIPGALDALSQHRKASIRLDVEGAGTGEAESVTFDPADHWDGLEPPVLVRPDFLPIVASNSLARMLARKANGSVEGFIIEGPTAGGHNAPPRGELRTNARDEPLYGDRDVVDLTGLAELGLPFWLAGGEGSPEALARALERGAAGIQVGTLFAYADESGMAEDVKRTILRGVTEGTIDLYTDLKASPTGFPFKVVQLEGTASDEDVYEERERICDLGYLRTAYRRPDGRIGYRCPAEPVDAYVRKGGRAEDTVGRRCLCNALMADVGRPQEREEGPELSLVTSGDELLRMDRFLDGRHRYTADDVLDYLLSGR